MVGLLSFRGLGLLLYSVLRACYSSCWGCGSGCYGGGWYLGCRPGPVRRLLFGPCRWYWGGCGYGCGYSYGCGYGGCGYGGCTTYDGCCSDAMSGTPTPAQPAQTPTPAKKPVMEPPPAMPTEPAPSADVARSRAAPGRSFPARRRSLARLPKTSATSADTSGILTVWVPYDAKVTINGLETRSTGSRREFVSYGLKPGLSYKYVVHAQVVREGKLLEDTRTVTLDGRSDRGRGLRLQHPADRASGGSLSAESLFENDCCVISKPTGCNPWAFRLLAVEIPA